MHETATVGRLVSTAFHSIAEGRLVGRLVEAVPTGRGKALAIAIDSEVVHPVGALEEMSVCGVLLNVTPARALPPTWHKMKILVHLHFLLTHVSWPASLVHHGGSRVHSFAVVRGSINVVGCLANDFVAVGPNGLKPARIHLLGRHLARSGAW